MREKLGELGPALARAARKAKPGAAAELGRMEEEADDLWKTMGDGSDLQVANDIRDFLPRVTAFKKATCRIGRGVGTGEEYKVLHVGVAAVMGISSFLVVKAVGSFRCGAAHFELNTSVVEFETTWSPSRHSSSTGCDQTYA